MRTSRTMRINVPNENAQEPDVQQEFAVMTHRRVQLQDKRHKVSSRRCE